MSKFTASQRLMVAEGFPACLVVTPAEAERRREYWLAHPPKAMPLFEINKTRDESPETAAFRAQEDERRRLKSLQQIDRMKTRLASKKIDFSKVRWDARRAKFVPLEGAVVVTTAVSSEHQLRVQQTVNQLEAQRRRIADVKPKPAVDPIWSRVKPDSAATLAKLNGVWDDKYAKLSGGLLVMTVTNRLKGLVKKGGEVKWQ